MLLTTLSIFDDLDKKFIDDLRKFNKEIILLINKFDNFNQIPNNDFYKYGIKNYFFYHVHIIMVLIY